MLTSHACSIQSLQLCCLSCLCRYLFTWAWKAMGRGSGVFPAWLGRAEGGQCEDGLLCHQEPWLDCRWAVCLPRAAWLGLHRHLENCVAQKCYLASPTLPACSDTWLFCTWPLRKEKAGSQFYLHGAFAPKSSRIQAIGCVEFVSPAPQLSPPVCWATSTGSAKAWMAGAAPYHAEGEVPAAQITRACCLLLSQALFL